ncbi:MAG: hypothetical protein ACREA0_31895, partial [bacterium]
VTSCSVGAAKVVPSIGPTGCGVFLRISADSGAESGRGPARSGRNARDDLDQSQRLATRGSAAAHGLKLLPLARLAFTVRIARIEPIGAFPLSILRATVKLLALALPSFTSPAMVINY